MPKKKFKSLGSLLILLCFLPACNSSKSGKHESSTDTPVVKPKSDGSIPSGTGVEKEKPESGKANVQGKVLYNSLAAANIEVKLCETFNRFLGGCSGEVYTALTGADGEYLIKNVPPKTYEGLTAKVFDTDFYVFATSGIVSAAKYKIEAGKTFFAPNANLFKADLQILNPKAAAKIEATPIEIQWAPYPDAAYYKLGVYADSDSTGKTEYEYVGKRVDGTSFGLDKPLVPGNYSLKLEAFNAKDVKLATSPDGMQFTVKGGAVVPAESQPNP